MKRILFFLLPICITTLASAQLTQKVLFIGNSYTYFNSMPSMVSQIATSTGNTLIYDSHTPGGATLYDHANNSTAETKINSNDWDYVVLQAQSQEPSWRAWQVASQVLPPAKQLCDSIRANSICSMPLFFIILTTLF